MGRLDRRAWLVTGAVAALGHGRPYSFANNSGARWWSPCQVIDGIDRYVATTSNWNSRADDPLLWEPLCRWVAVLAHASRQPIPLALRNAEDLLGATQYPPLVVRELYEVPLVRPGSVFARPSVVVASGVAVTRPLRHSMLVSRAGVRANDLNGSVVIANGNVVADDIGTSLIIADGDITIAGAAMQSLVIARQNVYVLGPWRSSIYAGGRVVVTHPRRLQADHRNEILVSDEPAPFGLVRFTSARDIGVATSSAAGGALVIETFSGGMFATGDLRTGDVLTHVNDSPVFSPAHFRSRVRDVCAHSGKVTVTVRRGAQQTTVEGKYPDPLSRR